MNDYLKITKDGLWSNNQALVALLGLCPLLATTSNAVNGLGLGLATTAVLIMSNGAISLIRHWVRPEVRLPVFVTLIASLTTVVELAMSAWFHELHKVLGIFIALIVTNCIIIGRAEAFASKNTFPKAIADALAVGSGFTLVLMVLGGLRELVGNGTLFGQAHLMFGEAARGLTFSLGPDYEGMLAAILPPGAFFGLGLLIALKNLIDAHLKERSTQKVALPEALPQEAGG